MKQRHDPRHRFNHTRPAQHKRVAQRQMEASGRQIDRLVCELYGLTEEEVRIVEESTG